MTYEYNPYTLGMYSDQNTEDRDSTEEETEGEENISTDKETKQESHAYLNQSKYSQRNP